MVDDALDDELALLVVVPLALDDDDDVLVKVEDLLDDDEDVLVYVDDALEDADDDCDLVAVCVCVSENDEVPALVDVNEPVDVPLFCVYDDVAVPVGAAVLT